MVTHRRSRAGCNTCRHRKVKCDEEQPSCGPCQRGSRRCDWSPQWKFVNLSQHMQRGYSVGNSDLLHAFQSKDQPGLNWEAQPDDDLYDSSDAEDLDDVTRSWQKPDSTGPPRPAQDLTLAVHHSTSLVLPGDSSTAEASSNIDATRDHIYRDPMNYGTRREANERHVTFFDKHVCRKLMPIAARLGLHLVGESNIIVLRAENFLPLRHAICAITLLDMGINNDRPELVAGSFKHYHHAVNASAITSASDSEETFFLHYIMLMYDLGCASSRWPDQRSSWILHLNILSKLCSASPNIGGFRAYISWYMVYLDCQALFAGYDWAGAFVGHFLNNIDSFPPWPTDDLVRVRTRSSETTKMVANLYQMTLLISVQFAEQASFTRRMRFEIAEAQSNNHSRQQQIRAIAWKQDRSWTQALQEYFGVDSDQAFYERQAAEFHGSFEFTQLQRAIVKLYLHTSMYSRQRLECPEYAEEDDALCTLVLKAVASHWLETKSENHHLVPGLFIAGYATREPQEKQMVLVYFKQIKEAGFLRSVGVVYRLLERVIGKQMEATREGRDMREIDWMSECTVSEIHSVVLGWGEPVRGKLD